MHTSSNATLESLLLSDNVYSNIVASNSITSASGQVTRYVSLKLVSLLNVNFVYLAGVENMVF